MTTTKNTLKIVNNMTEAQADAVETFRRRLELSEEMAAGGMEFKRWEVTPREETFAGKKTVNVMVLAVIGKKGDEGTGGEVYNRRTWQIFIGERGGVVTFADFNPKTFKKAKPGKMYKVEGMNRALLVYRY